MGYHVTILRTRQGRSIPITRAEVEALAAGGSEFQLRDGTLGEVDLVCFREEAEAARLTLQQGELWTKNPEEEQLRAMLDVAARLGHGARVRGDELETYRTPGETFTHPDDEQAVERAGFDTEKARRKRKIKAIVRRGVTVGVFVLLGLIMHYLSRK